MGKKLEEQNLLWRSMRLGDVRALALFEQECALVDGDTLVLDEAAWAQRLSDGEYAAVNSLLALYDGMIAAAGWISFQEEADEVQGFLDGRVHPAWRGHGIGAELLHRLERRAITQLDHIANGRRRVLRILYYDRREDAVALYEKAGFSFQFAEVEMRRSVVGDLPAHQVPEGIHFFPHSSVTAPLFFQAYTHAFSTRPGKLRQEDVWVHHFADPADPEFVPSLSLVVKWNGDLAGYAVVHRYPREDGIEGEEYWIAQMGVKPEYRRMGLATAMLAELAQRVAALGAAELILSVNVDNPEARAVYEASGFREVKTMTLFRKELDRSSWKDR